MKLQIQAVFSPQQGEQTVLIPNRQRDFFYLFFLDATEQTALCILAPNTN